MLNPASDDVLCGLTRDICCDGAREDDRATDGTGVVSLPESPDMLDATAKSSKGHGGKTTKGGVWSLPNAVGLRLLWKNGLADD